MKKLLLLAMVLFACSALAAEDRITYELVDAGSWPPDIRRQIERSVKDAVKIYNRNGRFRKKLQVRYNPEIRTADGNFNGSIRLGQSRGTRTVLHEIAHTLGIGTCRPYKAMVQQGHWSGPRANALLQEFDGSAAVLKAGAMHFWPYGLNYEREDSDEARIRHVKMVEAMLLDMGLNTVIFD